MAENTIGDKLIAAVLKAYGIDEKHVHTARYDEATKTAIVLTNGGKRVRFQEGDKPEPLSEIAITGINPVKRKPITGKSK